MLRLTVGTEEYIQVGEDVRIVFLGGTANHMRIMVDAPKEINIARGKAIESRARARGEKVEHPGYYAAEEHPEKWNRREDTLGGKRGKTHIVSSAAAPQYPAYHG